MVVEVAVLSLDSRRSCTREQRWSYVSMAKAATEEALATESAIALGFKAYGARHLGSSERASLKRVAWPIYEALEPCLFSPERPGAYLNPWVVLHLCDEHTYVVFTARYSLSNGKAPYCPVHTGPTADQYANQPLPGGIAKNDRRQLISAVGSRFRLSTVDFDHRRSIDGEIDRRRSIEEEKGKRRRGKEERRSTWQPSSPTRCPRALAARGSIASRCCP
ncbi:hypothetical protein B296_00022463 [Ensete ventricosum]|uniref:Uncharacterized protein n=1 Tax=Ensete ventricosum TaxID=4639 RepID=A0A427A8E9_ENSVE|nr:hypothetical protein B296_00022463 [Ensete ventricosum]